VWISAQATLAGIEGIIDEILAAVPGAFHRTGTEEAPTWLSSVRAKCLILQEKGWWS
jgi:hypothetical protein